MKPRGSPGPRRGSDRRRSPAAPHRAGRGPAGPLGRSARGRGRNAPLRRGLFSALAALLGAAASCGGSGEEAPRPAASAAAGREVAARGDRPARQSAARTGDAGPWFTDVTAESGCEFRHEAGKTPEKHLPETMGAGAVLFDADEDGDLDLYLVQGGPMRAPGPEPGTFAQPPGELPGNRLFANDGSGHFTDVSEHSGDAADTGYGMGAVTGDVDGDGHLDLFVTNLGPDVLLLGDGRGHFTDATERSGIRGNRWTGGAALFDADADGDLDLYVVGYVEIDLAHPVWCGKRLPGWRSACHPDRYEGLPDEFWRNRGDGTFELATEAAGLSLSTGKGLGVVPSDLDDDGDLDLYVANDSVSNALWINDGGEHFLDATLLSGTGVNRLGATEAGMGLAAADADGDGDVDLFVTNFDNESNTYYENTGGMLFEDRTVQVGLEASSRMPVGFGTVWSDLDEDGDLDLVVANGHIIDNIHLYHDSKTHAQEAQVFERVEGRYLEVPPTTSGLAGRAFVGRGLYAGDLDGDGDPDLVMTQCGGPAVILRNERGRGHSLWIEGLPRGTRVVVTTTDGREHMLEAVPQPSYFGQSAEALHLGLAAERVAAIRARALGGTWQMLAPPSPLPPGRLRLRLAGTLEIAAFEPL